MPPTDALENSQLSLRVRCRVFFQSFEVWSAAGVRAWTSPVHALVSALSDILVSHRCYYGKYLDDTELSDNAQPRSFLLPEKNNIQPCTESILSWMKSNKMKFNTDKTEIWPAGSASLLGVIGLIVSANTGGKCFFLGGCFFVFGQVPGCTY